MASLHPLAARILVAIGASSTSGALMIGSGWMPLLAASCCPPPEDTGPYTASLGAECTAELKSSFDQLVEHCEPVQADDCPAPDAVQSPNGAQAVCGPLHPAASAASSGSGGAGGGGAEGGDAAATGGSAMGGGGAAGWITCCYGVVEIGVAANQACGRPFVVVREPGGAGVAVVSPVVERAGWATAPGACRVVGPSRHALAAHWAGEAALEHASVASFACFVLDLLAVGAPSDLVRAAESALRDEIDHAERCFALASRYAGRALGPAPLPVAGAAIGGSLLDVTLRVVREGCVGETIAALVAQRTLERTTDPEARATLTVIARDEAAHAELAFRFVAWAARDEGVRRRIRCALPAVLERALEASAGAIEPDDDVLEAHGRPGGAVRARATREAIVGVVAPCLTALCQPRGSWPHSA